MLSTPLHRRLRMSALALALSAMALLPSASALAQEPSHDCPEGDSTLCGRHRFEAGTAAFEKGDYALAASEYQAALSFRAHPVIRFNLALSFARLGRPSAAIEQLRLVQADPTTDKELKVRAEREQRSAEQAVSRVTFRLADPARERIELDGSPVALEAGSELVLDPGSHHVRVISGSSVVLDQDLELSPGERVELRVGERSRRIDVVVVPDAPSAKPSPAPRPVALPSAVPRRGLSPVWFYAGAGATLVLTSVTVWSGLDTQRALSDYERDRPGLTPARAQERLDEGHALELRTNLLLAGSVVAGLGTAAIGIWLVDFGGAGPTSLAVVPGGLQASGRF